MFKYKRLIRPTYLTVPIFLLGDEEIDRIGKIKDPSYKQRRANIPSLI